MTDIWEDRCEGHRMEVKYRSGDQVVLMNVDTLDELVILEEPATRALGEFLIKCADKMKRKP